MKRYIYCPEEQFLEEATELAKKVNLPILIGENKDSEKLNFDRNLISVIKIPENKSLRTLYEKVPLGFHQSIHYINEFKELKNNTKLFINKTLVKPLYEEMHAIKYNFLCQKIGDYSCIIVVNNEQEEEFYFVVN